MTSNNNQLEAWAIGDAQQQQHQQQHHHLDSSMNPVHQPTSSDMLRSENGDTITTTNNANTSSVDRNESYPSSHFASASTTSQSNINNALNVADTSHRRSNNNNQASIILNNNHNDNNINSGTATRIRIKFQKLKKFFTKN